MSFKFPSELETALSPLGRRILAGRAFSGILTDPSARFCAIENVLDPRFATDAIKLLDAAMYDALTPLESPIPPETIYAQTKNYEELLPKTMRQRTAYLERKRGRASVVAEETGLATMLRSQSFHALACALAGVPLRKKHGIQVLCYGQGDYAGPHTDHHPEDAVARDGYIDVHLSLTNSAVAHQWLVYARRGHFSQVASAAMTRGLTGYRLPFWHYTTPLQGKRGQEANARRWLLLGTFLF
jgi:hypothetical protein